MFFTPIALLIVANPVFGGTLVQSDFSSSLGPFSICNAKSPSAGTISHKALSMYFDENDYDGTRDDRGVEICVFKPETRSNVPQMHKEGWQGFRLLKRNSWHDVVIRMRVSAEKDGAYEVWWNKRKIYSSVGIDVGFGTWTKDTLVEGWYFKNGIYAHDWESYTNTTRTLYLDDVKWYETDVGESDGYRTVAPHSHKIWT
ncbi:hypothetical protein FGLOB1_8965 [Fusarium globosum]|uniref:Uncharacterized protein n=1 Tax=Fusarium globosum TaxID=78864 RepID=A0A8H6D421_9HYPO|nr:hypothetical protein FGLOB1_8965 [Fusarium globosum]